jgi:hypothetical protein
VAAECFHGFSLLTSRATISSQQTKLRTFTAKTATEEVRHFYEERSPVTIQTGFELSRERTEAVAIYVIVVTDVERCTGIWRPAEQELSFDIRRQRIKINATARKDEPGKLISTL